MDKVTKPLTGADARKRILAGVNAVYKTVALTLGPEGRNALLPRSWNRGPRSTNDGVTISENVMLKAGTLTLEAGSPAARQIAGKLGVPGALVTRSLHKWKSTEKTGDPVKASQASLLTFAGNMTTEFIIGGAVAGVLATAATCGPAALVCGAAAAGAMTAPATVAVLAAEATKQQQVKIICGRRCGNPSIPGPGN